MKVAVEGCCHGELDNIYSHIASLERKRADKVDLLLICGDFQALGGFYKYYIGQKAAPVLTIVIGGNHEASNYLWELYHGGWLAPNIYFLGFSGCVQVNGVRIAGSSGIYKSHDYARGHHEMLPYNNSDLRSIYHTRKYDVLKLAQLSSPNIFLSHDWPNTIEQHGNTEQLLRCKPFFRKETRTSSLGSPPMLDLLKSLKPQWWFSAHLHVKFEALYRHDKNKDKPLPGKNPEEIVIEDVDDEESPVYNPDETKIGLDDAFETGSSSDIKQTPDQPSPSERASQAPENTETRFLALDKCLPKRHFLEVIDIPVPQLHSPPVITFDPEWLAITRALHPFLCTTREQVPLPNTDKARALVAKELEWVRLNVPNGGLCNIEEAQKFWRTAPGPKKSSNRFPPHNQPRWYTNPQTEALMQILQIENKINPVPAGTAPSMVQSSVSSPETDPDEAPDTERPHSEVNDDAEPQKVRNDISGSVGSPAPLQDQATSGGWSPSLHIE